MGIKNLSNVKYGRKWYRNEYLRSTEWKILRARVLGEAKHTCEKCGCKATDVHHMDYAVLKLDPKKVNTFLMALCRKCHDKIELAKKLKLIPKNHQRAHIEALDFKIVNEVYRKRFESTIIDTKLYNKILQATPTQIKLIKGLLKVSFTFCSFLFARQITSSQYEKILLILNPKYKSKEKSTIDKQVTKVFIKQRKENKEKKSKKKSKKKTKRLIKKLQNICKSRLK